VSALRRQATPAVASGPALEARVSNPDPAALTVTIDSFDGDAPARHAWEVASWPRAAKATPARGDRCLVVMSETGRPWVVVGDWSGPPEPPAPVWTPLPFNTALWGEWDTTTFPSGYWKSPDGWVQFRGIARCKDVPVLWSQMFASGLPEGYRPATLHTFATSVNGGAGRIQVYPNGTAISCEFPAGTPRDSYWTLDGIGYWAER
jgi:hypothetical protein